MGQVSNVKVRKPVKLPVSGLRPKARVFAPEAFDPGQVVGDGLFRGVVWSLGPEHGKGRDSRWVVCEDGVIRLAILDKAPAKDGGGVSFASWGHAQWDSVSSAAAAFSVEGWVSVGEVEQPELPGLPELPEQPSLLQLAYGLAA